MFILEEYELIQMLLQKMNKQELTLQEYQQLQHLIIRNEEVFRTDYPLMKTSISADQIMYISDTHIGGVTEDIACLQSAYDTALRKNIKTVIHVGDLIEACANNQFNKSKATIEEEIAKALYYMPNEITTKLLMGNHDYSAIRTYPDVTSLFFNSPKLEVLGMQRVLLNWNNMATIKLHHEIKQLKYNKEEEKGTFEILGHYHDYSVKEGQLFLPALCKDHTQEINESLAAWHMTFQPIQKPYFIISSKKDEHTILFDLYYVSTDKYIVQKSQEHILVDCKTKQMKKGLN